MEKLPSERKREDSPLEAGAPWAQNLPKAVGVRFELTIPFQVYQFSRLTPSAARPPHRLGHVLNFAILLNFLSFVNP